MTNADASNADNVSTPTKPLKSFRIGPVQAAVWRNFSSRAGTEYFAVTFERRYRDEAGEWKSTSSFGRDDLLLLAKVADQAHSFIVEESQRVRDEARASKGDGAADRDDNDDRGDHAEPVAGERGRGSR